MTDELRQHLDELNQITGQRWEFQGKGSDKVLVRYFKFGEGHETCVVQLDPVIYASDEDIALALVHSANLAVLKATGKVLK